MNSKIKELLTDYKNCDLNNISCQINNIGRRILVYNSNITEPLQKIWIYIPKCKIMSLFSKDTILSATKIVFSSRDDDIKKLQEFIFNLENKIIDITKQSHNFDHLEVKRSIQTSCIFPPIMSIQFPLSRNKLTNELKCDMYIFDSSNLKIDHSELKKNDCISSYIELTDVWTNDKSIGFNWNFLQIKILDDIDFTKCLFEEECGFLDNSEVIIERNQQGNIVPTVPINKPPTPKPNKTEVSSKKFVPSLQDLQNKIKSLRKTNQQENIFDNEIYETQILQYQNEIIKFYANDELINKNYKEIKHKLSFSIQTL